MKHYHAGWRHACRSQLLVLLTAFMALLSFATPNLLAAPKVALMPSYAQSPSYGNAERGVAIRVWGRVWNVSGNFTYSLDFGEGSPLTGSGSVSNREIGADRTYTTAGIKTVKLSVTEVSTGITVTREAKLNVIAPTSITHDQRVNMAIEKGLLYLYRNSFGVDNGNKDLATRLGWYSTVGNLWGTGSLGATVLAFEEAGHLPGNDYEQDIYAETVQKGLNYILNNGYGGYHNISNQSSGNPDSDGDGKGVMLVPNDHGTYANSFAGLALILALKNEQEAKNTTISGGPFNGQTYYQVIQDFVDLLAWCQGDPEHGRSGSWVYNVLASNNDGRYDDSAQQWPHLVFLAANERWNMPVQQWIINNGVNGFRVLQHQTVADSRYGGVGYDHAASWVNLAKTGGMLVSYFMGNKGVNDPWVSQGLTYIGKYWHERTSTGTGENNMGFAGDFYGMYGLKKGLQIMGVTHVSTPAMGQRDWYRDMSAWLLGNATLLDADRPVGSTTRIAPNHRVSSWAFGQLGDGSWTTSAWPISGIPQLATAHSILILARTITVPPPVAQIKAVQEQAVLRSFTLDGSDSYHLDPTRTIVSYNWDFNGDNVTDATGPVVTNPGYPTIGNKTVKLTVIDDIGQEASASVVVVVTDKDVPPVAVAIPVGQLPAYGGKVGQPIQLDGTESYDPDVADVIIKYEWDTNADGVFGDATGATPTVTYNSAFNGKIALRVTSRTPVGLEKTSIGEANLYASADDLLVTSLSASNLVPGSSATVTAVVSNDPTSSQGFNGVVVRFYNGDPLTTGQQVGASSSVNLPVGGSATVTANLTGLNGAAEVWVFVDATKQIPEYDELNNFAKVGVLNEPPTITCAASQTVEATSADGATITIPVSFADSNSDALTVTWTLDGQQAATRTVAAGSTTDSITVTLGKGSHNVSVSITDGKSDAVSCSLTVSVEDTTPPSIACPAAATLEYPAAANPGVTGLPTVADAAGTVEVSYSDIILPNCGNTMTIVRTWTAVDENGLRATCTQQINIVDTTAPVIECPAAVTVEFPGSTAPATTGMATASDFNGVASITHSDAVTEACGNTTTIVRTWTATDVCGNTASCTQTIKVVDTTAPVISCPPSVTLEYPADTAPSATGIATATDASGTANLTHSDVTTEACGNTFTIVRTWTAADACGNVESCTQVIKVVDTTAPAINCPAPVTLEYPANTEPSATGVATATDASGSTTITHSDVVTEDCGNTVTIVRTWTAADACGNTSSCTQVIKVVDTTAPAINCPAPVTLEYPANTEPSATGVATATDASGSATITHSDVVTEDCGRTFTIVRTWTATDACGNASSCTQVIKVVDTTAPAINCPAPVTLEFPANVSPANTGTATASDANGVANVSFTDVVTATCGNGFTIVRTWTATDLCGLVSSCTQTINVVDTTAPALTVPGSVTLEYPANTTVQATGVATATDVGGNVTISYADTVTAKCGNTVTIARTWTAVDACGNSSSGVQTINVVDTIAPEITSNSRDILPKEVPISFTFASTDANGVQSLTLSAASFKPNKAGVLVADTTSKIVVNGAQVNILSGGVGTVFKVTAVAVDLCGNTTTKVFTVNVLRPANEGVGNGVDGNTPGHDNNGGNDAPGTSPGNPGASTKKK
ncbi:MAG TPA: PKD domain-containing protein [Methylomirabilota bacterium]|nr:PKD domain-containing protein [Methylomirabilota bacterium]